MKRSILVKITCAMALLVLFAQLSCDEEPEWGLIAVNATNDCQAAFDVHLESVLRAYVGLKFYVTTFDEKKKDYSVLITRTDTLDWGVDTLGTLKVNRPGLLPGYHDDYPTIVVTLTEPTTNHLVATSSDENWCKASFVEWSGGK